jgi:tetratricopeptide (TPR) repeat protein
MRAIVLQVLLLMVTALPAAAQLGKQVVVEEGTPEDAELTAIQNAKGPQQKLALLDKFAAAHPTGDMALMADNLYVSIYSGQQDYAKAYEYGDKALALDPNNINVAVALVRDAQLQGNTAKMVYYGVRVGGMVARYEAEPAPAGTSPDVWAEEQKQALASAGPLVNWVAQSVYAAIAAQGASAAKTNELTEMAKAFPNSTYAPRSK